jgi:hypothetical protein
MPPHAGHSRNYWKARLMFKIEYERSDGHSAWLMTAYPDPDDADNVAKRLLRGSDGEIVRTTVVEQAGYVYSQHVDYGQVSNAV